MTPPEPRNPARDPFDRDPSVPRNDEPPARYPQRGDKDDADWTPPRPPDLLARRAAQPEPAPEWEPAAPESPPPPAPPPVPPPAPPPQRPLRGLSPVNEAEVRGITATRPHRGTLLLVLGIAGIVFCQLLCPIVWILANGDLADIRSGRMDPEGRGLTQASLVLGIVGTVLLLAPLVLIVLFGVAVGGFTGF